MAKMADLIKAAQEQGTDSLIGAAIGSCLWRLKEIQPFLREVDSKPSVLEYPWLNGVYQDLLAEEQQALAFLAWNVERLKEKEASGAGASLGSSSGSSA